MTKLVLRAALVALAVAGGAAAQPRPPGPGPNFTGPKGLFGGLSQEGKTIVWSAMKTLQDGTPHRIEMVRAHELDLLGADTLDVADLRRTMTEERNLAQGQEMRRQEALLGAYQRLGVADRRAFVSAARELQARVEAMRQPHKPGIPVPGQ